MKLIYILAVLGLTVSCNMANKDTASSKTKINRSTASSHSDPNTLYCSINNYGRQRLDYTDADKGNHTYYTIKIRSKQGEDFNVSGNFHDGNFTEIIHPLIQRSDVNIPQNLYAAFSQNYGSYSYQHHNGSASTYSAYGKLDGSTMYTAKDTNLVFYHVDGSSKIFSPRDKIPAYSKFRDKLNQAIKYCDNKKLTESNWKRSEVRIDF